MDELLVKVAGILEELDLSAEDNLRELEYWDSLSVLSLQAMLASDYGIELSTEQILGINTVQDIYSLIERHGAR